MARPVSYPATLSITCRRCGKSYGPAYYRHGGGRVNKTCTPCLDGWDADELPEAADAIRVEVPAGHRSRRRKWPEGVIFMGDEPAEASAPSCLTCGAPLPVPVPGAKPRPGRRRTRCGVGCRVQAFRAEERAKQRKRAAKTAGRTAGAARKTDDA